jgi:hypothetical protein
MLSVGFNLLLALALMGAGLKDLSLQVHAIPSLVGLAAGAPLFLESIVRLIRLLGGETTGSLLAFLVKPVYYMAIKDTPGL